MEKNTKQILAAVLPIALFILAIPIVLTVLLFVSCERSERERAAEKARYVELLGGAPSAIVLSGGDVVQMNGGFFYTDLLLPAANAARGESGAYEYIVWDSENLLVGDGCLYLSAYAYSVTEEAVNDSYIFSIDLAEREAESVYSVPRAQSGEITLLSLSEGSLFWLEGNEAVLCDVSAGEEIGRFGPAEGTLMPAGDGFAYYEETEEDGTGRIVFLENGAGEILSYSYEETEQTGFAGGFLFVERGVAVLSSPDGYSENIGIYVRSGDRLDGAQTEQFLKYKPFAYGWQFEGEYSSSICQGGVEVSLSGEWLSERSAILAELFEMKRVRLGGAYALKLSDGTPCICYEAAWIPTVWGDGYSYDTLFFVWTEEDTLAYLGSVRSYTEKILCLLPEGV